jgi:hypothetical protein
MAVSFGNAMISLTSEKIFVRPNRFSELLGGLHPIFEALVEYKGCVLRDSRCPPLKPLNED